MFGSLQSLFATGQQQNEDPTKAGDATQVLIADDEPDLCCVIKLALEGRGYRVHVATNGQEAVDMARQHKPAAIVLDGNMPVMNGFEVLKKLRGFRSTAGIPVIMLTGRSAQADLLTGYQRGACHYLIKPVSIEELLSALKTALG